MGQSRQHGRFDVLERPGPRGGAPPPVCQNPFNAVLPENREATGPRKRRD